MIWSDIQFKRVRIKSYAKKKPAGCRRQIIRGKKGQAWNGKSKHEKNSKKVARIKREKV